MTFSNINIGVTANDGSGDPLRDAMILVNDNFEIAKNSFTSQVTTGQLDIILGSYSQTTDLDPINDSIIEINISLDGKALLVHTHSIANITGLQTALDAKVSSTTFNSSIASINSSISGLINDKIGDAPSDGFTYGRKDGAWIRLN